eukprot:8338273-Ditylum_brightwellii.AAC.1
MRIVVDFTKMVPNPCNKKITIRKRMKDHNILIGWEYRVRTYPPFGTQFWFITNFLLRSGFDLSLELGVGIDLSLGYGLGLNKVLCQ